MAKYPNTLQEDLKILEEDDLNQTLSFNQRNCVLFRLGEKEILHFFIEFSEYMVSLLSMIVMIVEMPMFDCDGEGHAAAGEDRRRRGRY